MMRFAILGREVRVDLPSRGGPLEEFLRAYFSPCFDVDEAEARAPVASIRAALGEAPMPSDRFAGIAPLDVDRSKGFLRCTGRALEDGADRWVLLEPSRATVRVSRRERALEVWGRDEASLRVPLLRLVEDVLLDQLQLDGAVVVHASAVVTPRGAVLAVGNKGAGKTSILTRSLAAFDVAKMANDNVILRAVEGRWVAHAWPAFFKAEVATVASTPELVRDFPPEHRGVLADDRALWDLYWKVPLYPAQCAARFGAAIAREAPVAALVFPRFAPHEPTGLRARSAHGLEADLFAALQGIHNPNHPEWLGYNPVPAARPRERLASLVGCLGDVELYELVWAPSLDDLLGQIPALRPQRRTFRACAAVEPSPDGWPPLPD
jgi:hypothetical protein